MGTYICFCEDRLTLFIGAVGLQWNILTEVFWEHVESGEWSKVQLTVGRFIFGDFGAAAVLVSLGVVLGTLSPLQMLVMALMEIVIYSLNAVVCYYAFKIADIGGSMCIHAFGAYFGLAVSFMMGHRTLDRNSKSLFAPNGHPLAATRYSSDIMAMVGTVFLWMFWPSFNGAPGAESVRDRVLTNTLLALAGACTSTFAASALVGGHLDMLHIQNASLAGGVGVGALADLEIHPASAMALGMVVGVVSVLGYHHLTPLLRR